MVTQTPGVVLRVSKDIGEERFEHACNGLDSRAIAL